MICTGTRTPGSFALLLVLTALSCAVTLRAQSPPLDENSAGTLYVIAFPDTTTNRLDTTLAPPTDNVISLLIYSAVDNSVHITGNGFDRFVDARAGKFAVVNLLDSSTRVDNVTVTTAGEVSNRTFRVEAHDPIVLYCYVMTRFGAETWTPVPVDKWGMEYRAAMAPADLAVDIYKKDIFSYTRNNKAAPSEILVVAAYDSTRVTINSNGMLVGLPRTSVTLNAGQAYQIQSFVDVKADSNGNPQPDLGGSRIAANKPFGVITGNSRVQIVTDRPEITNNSVRNMMVEWLASVEQYGTRFVWMPTWDTRRLTGDLNEKVGEKRTAEFARIYGGADGTSVLHDVDSTHYDTVKIGAGYVEEYRMLIPHAHYFRTTKPAQAMMHSSSVVKFNGTISGKPGSQSFDSWGPYMVEMVPQEEWTTFAPFYAPFSIYDTKHYINVAADSSAFDKIFDETGAPFDFNRGAIPGTPYIWGTMQITTAQDHYLEATEGATFYAVQYGLRPGVEAYRPEVPGQTFAEYHELLGRSYGMALAPSRKILRPSDTVKITKLTDSCGTKLEVRCTNARPVGLLSATFSNATNAAIAVTSPTGWNDIAGLATARLYVHPVDPTSDAAATVVIRDRTGGVRGELQVMYDGQRLDFSPTRKIDFGEITLGGTRDTVVVVTNPRSIPMMLNAVQLRSGNQSFIVIGTTPALPVSLGPGQSVQVHIRVAPASDRNLYRDTLLIRLPCTDFRLPLQIGPVPPCITVSDLDFDTLDVGQQRALKLRICNEGHGTISFNNPAGGRLITWLTQNFTVDAAELTALKGITLGMDACTEINVRFSATSEGTFETVARIWANTRECRDTSIWHAVVKAGHVQDVERDDAAALSAAIRPNPSTGRSSIHFAIATPGRVRVAIYDATGREVARPLDEHLDAGEHELPYDAAGLAAGAYYCRIIAGSAVQTVPMVLWK